MFNNASVNKYTSHQISDNTSNNTSGAGLNAAALSGMLALVIDRLAESQDCFFCRIRDSKDRRCQDIDLCRNLLFDGIFNAWSSSEIIKN